MNLQERKDLLVQLGNFMRSNDEAWQNAKQRASAENSWFIPEFVELSVNTVAGQFLADAQLQHLINRYRLEDHPLPKRVGIVMAGNIPLEGFHDIVCAFITGHNAVVMPSPKDKALIDFLIKKLKTLNKKAEPYFTISGMLKGCDAYIATGTKNSFFYFEQYFAKYPHIIRKNRTSVAILSGDETDEELEALANDVYQHFGLGCRSVTKIYVPVKFNFERLLNNFKKYNYLADFHKYKNNYDYNLAIHLLNNKHYMSNESLLLVEDKSPFSPISQLHYEYYNNVDEVKQSLDKAENIACVTGKTAMGFGSAAQPGICDFTDGVDTVEFLNSLS